VQFSRQNFRRRWMVEPIGGGFYARQGVGGGGGRGGIEVDNCELCP